MRIQTSAPTEWLTLALILLCYGLWAAFVALWSTGFWVLSVIGLPVLAAFHTSLQHETVHGHPTRWAWLNEALVALPIALVFPYRRYRDLHLQHHRDEHLTDPFEDPESYFWDPNDVRQMNDLQQLLFGVNNTFLGRLLIGPALTIVGFARTERKRILVGEPGVRRAWILHGLGAVCVFAFVAALNMPIWVYMLLTIYPALSLTSVRAYAEHQAAEHVGARSAVVEAGRFWSILFLNNNLHVVHHASPATPWYELPALYKQRRHIYLRANENTRFDGYSEVWRRFAFTKKQPVAHPLMADDPGLDDPAQMTR